MISWSLKEEGFDPQRISQLGNKYLIGNGYLGIRGTLEEYRKEQFPAINLAGIYDQVGTAWREPLNAPNALYTYVEWNGAKYRLPEAPALEHSVSLDYRHGIFSRRTVWNTPQGKLVLEAQRFASMADPHLIGACLSLQADCDSEAIIFTGIDGEVWDINGPHYDRLEFGTEENNLLAVGITHEKQERVAVSETVAVDFDYEEEVQAEERLYGRRLRLQMRAGVSYRLYKYIGIYTDRDGTDCCQSAVQTAVGAGKAGYDSLLFRHRECWERLWSNSEVIIDGDDTSMEALNYSIYHLHCIAPRHSDKLSIAARGLSGQTYKGAVFWDTEMFMLDFYLLTEPAVARSLLKYRIDTLEGARNKARSYGYSGAFYAWESQDGGYDACSDYNVVDVFTGRPMRTYFKDKQLHISAAVVYGLMRYVEYTGSFELLEEGGAEVILECACFYYGLLIKKLDRDCYELQDVIGPDEYHERVNNNAYTNRMVKYTFDSAVRVLEKLKEFDSNTREYLESRYQTEQLLKRYQDASRHILLKEPDASTGRIEQFDGYEELEDVSLEEVKSRLLHEKEYWGGAYGVASHTKIIKQADVVTMLNLFAKEYEEEILLKNWQYYEPRTEHGSSLSACMYACLACKCHMPDRAYPFFLKSARTDILQQGKEWAGLIYIGGTHPASAGGAYMTAIEGFAGIHEEEGELKAVPCLPDSWRRMLFKIMFRGSRYQIEVTKQEAKITRIES